MNSISAHLDEFSQSDNTHVNSLRTGNHHHPEPSCSPSRHHPPPPKSLLRWLAKSRITCLVLQSTELESHETHSHCTNSSCRSLFSLLRSITMCEYAKVHASILKLMSTWVAFHFSIINIVLWTSLYMPQSCLKSFLSTLDCLPWTVH